MSAVAHILSVTMSDSVLSSPGALDQVRAERRKLLADPEKIARGQFFTRGTQWLAAPIRGFIEERILHVSEFLDPFAGEGDLLAVCETEFRLPGRGLDISTGRWKQNDSLRNIPRRETSLIVTNPPYLARNSARRKGLWSDVGSYFDEKGRDDLYQVALDRCLEAGDFVVAIIPETFLLSSFPKTRLSLVMVVQEEMFEDTEAPVCVAAFDASATGQANVFLGNDFVCTLPDLLAMRPRPLGRPEMRFNAPEGQIGLRAVDSVRSGEPIRFMRAEHFQYSREKLRHSSRHMTFIEVPGLADAHVDAVVATANDIVAEFRVRTRDLGLSPFKGNNNVGRRRRRLDYTVARAILERSVAGLAPSLF